MSGLADVLTGRILSGDDDADAQKFLDQATGAYKDIKAPKLNPIDLKDYSWLGDLAPEQISAGPDVQYHGTSAHLADAATAGPTAFDDISTDPRLKDDQMASLAALKDLAANGGMNGKDQANLSKVQNQVAQADRGRRDAILQNMAARGMSGGGNELLAQLQSNQAATDRQAQQGLDIAGMAQQRALDALMQGGQLAGNIRGQDFGEAAQRAAAKDAVDRFNAAQQTGSNQFNANSLTANDQFNAGNSLRTDISNRDTDIGVKKVNAGFSQDANQYNTTGRQNTANAGVDNTNKETAYNANIPQQNFGNEITLAGGKAGAAGAGVNYYQHESDQDRQGFKDLVAGGIKAATPAPTPGKWKGGIIPGKAPLPGDHPANDVVLTPTSPGELVLPRSLTKNLLNEISTHGGGDVAKNSRASDPFDIEAFLSALTGKKDHKNKIHGGHDVNLSALKKLAGKQED